MACWQGQGDQRERHGVPAVPEAAVPMTERIVPVPVQVPVPQWEQVASAPRALEMADTVRGLSEILECLSIAHDCILIRFC